MSSQEPAINLLLWRSSSNVPWGKIQLAIMYAAFVKNWISSRVELVDLLA